MDSFVEDSVILEHIKSLKLLCVEDDKTTQYFYRLIFEKLTKEVVFADNGSEGYQKFLDNEFDIIICDYKMPVLNGLEFIEKIREKNKDIPIIFVTAIDDIDDDGKDDDDDGCFCGDSARYAD